MIMSHTADFPLQVQVHNTPSCVLLAGGVLNSWNVTHHIQGMLIMGKSYVSVSPTHSIVTKEQ